MKNILKAYTQNRELSWLAFNDRVLEEAQDETVPLLERMKFLAIFTSNLDEFFMIRVGSLYDIVSLGNVANDRRTGMTAQEQLERIYAAVPPLYKKRDRIYRELKQQLKVYGICSLKPKELEVQERKYLKSYFKEQILPMLSPQIVDVNHPFPHLQNKEIYAIANLTRKGETKLGIVPLSSMLPDVVYLPGGDLRFVRMEIVLLEYMDLIFEQYVVTDKNYICVTRNADISPDDELFDVEEDFRYHMKKLLHKRRRMAIVRLETAFPLEEKLDEVLRRRCKIERSQIFQTTVPMKMDYIYALLAKVPPSMKQTLLYPSFVPQNSMRLGPGEMLQKAKHQDMLFSYDCFLLGTL